MLIQDSVPVFLWGGLPRVPLPRVYAQAGRVDMVCIRRRLLLVGNFNDFICKNIGLSLPRARVFNLQILVLSKPAKEQRIGRKHLPPILVLENCVQASAFRQIIKNIFNGHGSPVWRPKNFLHVFR